MDCRWQQTGTGIHANPDAGQLPEIRNAFTADEIQPVRVAGVTYNGGLDTYFRLDGARRLAELAKRATVDFTDAYNVAHTLTLAKARDVVLTVGQDHQAKFMDKQAAMVAIDHASDETAVNAISY